MKQVFHIQRHAIGECISSTGVKEFFLEDLEFQGWAGQQETEKAEGYSIHLGAGRGGDNRYKTLGLKGPFDIN